MLIGQAIASHNAAMECYRRAMISEQTFEGRRENLNQANKLSRTFAVLTEALGRHPATSAVRIAVRIAVRQRTEGMVRPANRSRVDGWDGAPGERLERGD
jgi:hypothetical protein